MKAVIRIGRRVKQIRERGPEKTSGIEIDAKVGLNRIGSWIVIRAKWTVENRLRIIDQGLFTDQVLTLLHIEEVNLYEKTDIIQVVTKALKQEVITETSKWLYLFCF